jgi:hypothetical protein
MFMFGEVRSDASDSTQHIQKIENLGFHNAIIQVQTIAPGFDEPSHFQEHQLLGDICLSQAERSFHVTDALFAIA